jgi:septal ring factor EnvC (AmiA/AmiB activator)
MESSPAKEAASQKVKNVYKSQRLRDQEDRKAEEERKKLEKATAESIRFHNEFIASARARAAEHRDTIEGVFADPPQAAGGDSN